MIKKERENYSFFNKFFFSIKNTNTYPDEMRDSDQMNNSRFHIFTLRCPYILVKANNQSQNNSANPPNLFAKMRQIYSGKSTKY